MILRIRNAFIERWRFARVYRSTNEMSQLSECLEHSRSWRNLKFFSKYVSYEKDRNRRDLQKNPLDRIPWNEETPPAELVALVDSDVVGSCRAIDLGCVAGNYAIYLASC